jgi:nucleoside-diphosphate-sugar epimerase
MRILFTGASSFTGYWMLRSLAARGHSLAAVFTRPGLDAYEGLRRRRVEMTSALTQPLWASSTGNGSLLPVLRERQCFDLLCLHGAEVGNYKSPDFDWRLALQRNLAGMEELLDCFAGKGGRAVLITGTYFEADEGRGDSSSAFSPYGLAKTLTWQALRHLCERRGLSIGKYVLPNPVGPWEEPRLVAYLVSEWRAGRVPVIRCPDYVRDNLPVGILAEDYADFAVALLGQPKGSLLRRNPSGWVETVGEFAQRVAGEFSRLSDAAMPVELAVQTLWDEPRSRHNSDSCLSRLGEHPERFWREWHAFYDPRPQASHS